MTETVRIGCGAGYAGDRWEPALELAEKGGIDYLAFECLAERTIALAALAMHHDPDAGYNPRLAERMTAVLPACVSRDITIVSNMGAANPLGAARKVCEIANTLGLDDLRCAALLGDDVTEIVRGLPELRLMESDAPLESILPRMAAANAYLGADAVCQALETGADVVMTGRVADPSLFVAPMMHRLGWSYDDYARLAQATAAGHLLECAGQVTGGYFADPGVKDVEGLARLGFPFADVGADGSVVIGKVDGSGGRVDRMTCTEQLLYEMHDPTAYITPDCVLDVTGLNLEECARDRVAVHGAKARARTATYKVSVGYFDGFMGEGQISYGGPNAVARARLAGDVVEERLKMRGFSYTDFRAELIGLESLHGPAPEGTRPEPYEVRLRIAGRTETRAAAEAIGWEVETLLTNGPQGGAGDQRQVKQILAVQSVLLPRDLITPHVEVLSAS